MRLVLPYVQEIRFRPTRKHKRRSVTVRAYGRFEVSEINGREADEIVTPNDWECLDRAHRTEAKSASVRIGYGDRVFKPVHLGGIAATPESYESALRIVDPSPRQVKQLARDAWWTPALAPLDPSSGAERFPLAYPMLKGVSELSGESVVTKSGDGKQFWSESARELHENVVLIDGTVHVACYDPVWALRGMRRLAMLLSPLSRLQHGQFRLDRLDAALDFHGMAKSSYRLAPERSGHPAAMSRYLRRDDVVALAEGLIPILPAIKHAIALQAVESDVSERLFEVASNVTSATPLDRHRAEELLEAIATALSGGAKFPSAIIGPADQRALNSSVARWRFEREYLDEFDRDALDGI